MKTRFTMSRTTKLDVQRGRFRSQEGKFGWFAFLLLFAVFAFAADKPSEVKGGNGIILPPPPSTEAKPVTENIHGTTLTDPYRWLEDAKSPATRAWIDEQMKYTELYLSQVKIRPEIASELTKLERVESYSIPIERGGNYFFKKRLADENQGSIYVRRGLHGQDDRLVDATKLSADQNTSVQINDISKDGTVLVYGIRSGGADEQSVHILDVAKNQELAALYPPRVIPASNSARISKDSTTRASIPQDRLSSTTSSDRTLPVMSSFSARASQVRPLAPWNSSAPRLLRTRAT